MATAKGVRAALKMLAMNFAGDVTDEKVRVWHAALLDVTDEQLAVAVPRLIREYTGEFIPPVAKLREAAGANERPALDVEDLLRRIDRCGSYNPNTGWSSPRVETVRQVFGEAIADAYGAAGGASRLFADNETTRDIAARDFGAEIKATVEQRGAACLEPPLAPKQLEDGA